MAGVTSELLLGNYLKGMKPGKDAKSGGKQMFTFLRRKVKKKKVQVDDFKNYKQICVSNLRECGINMSSLRKHSLLFFSK